ncbi:MAG: peptidylprolyl isomerase [Zoogloeaceae bacterium]|nr:peptidylprolyl isomerase [Zoogloeaceae bacterium]
MSSRTPSRLFSPAAFRTVRKVFRAALPGAFLVLSPLAIAQAQETPPSFREIDRIVVIVGNEAITQVDIAERLESVTYRLTRQNIRLPAPEVLREQVLDRLIMEKAQLQAAKEAGIGIDDRQLEQEITRIAASQGLTLEDYRQTLERDGIPPARHSDLLREEFILSRLRDREVESQITISEAEIDNFLTQMRAANAEEAYRVAHILLRAPESARPEQLTALQARAEDILKRARAGENFAELAASHSDNQDAFQGGDMGWRAPDRLPAIFADAVVAMQPGETVLLRSPNGFHLVKLLEKRGNEAEEDGNVQQTHARHILIRIDEITSEADARRRLEDLRERLRHGEDFAELARLYSQDAAAANGGDMGWVNPGDTVPEFERAMNALQEGEVSEVIRTPFGFHIIKVEARRLQDMSEEKQRFGARQALRERKGEEAYQDWLRQLLDRTYVEYRQDEQ